MIDKIDESTASYSNLDRNLQGWTLPGSFSRTSSNWDVIEDLLDRPYSAQLWVFQEAVLARKKISLSGSLSFPWEWLQDTVFQLDRLRLQHLVSTAKATLGVNGMQSFFDVSNCDIANIRSGINLAHLLDIVKEKVS